MNTNQPIYREIQFYRELPPFTLLTVVGTLFGWFLVVWVVALGRPLGALTLPPWLALAIGLPLGILLPLAYTRMHMLTEVYSDRVVVQNGMTGRAVFPFTDVTAIDMRTDDIRHEYNVRNIGIVRTTSVAYTVSSDNGAQLLLGDGRKFLIGSKQPEALGAALLPAWQAVQPDHAGSETADS